MPDHSPETLPDPAAAGWRAVEDVGFERCLGPFWSKPLPPGTAGSAAEPALWALKTDARHANRNDRVHGGVIASLADHAMGNSARAAVDGQATATIQMDMQFIASGKPGEFLVARTEVLRRTRSMVFLRCEISAGARRVALATGVWKILGA